METKSSKIPCPCHPEKSSTFYCYSHAQFCCTKCLTSHIQCQEARQFEAIEEILSQIPSKVADVSACIKTAQIILSEQETSLSSRCLMLKSLLDQDTANIEEFFETQIKKVTAIKEKVLSTFKSNALAAVELLSAHKTDFSIEAKKTISLEDTWKMLSEKLAGVPESNAKEKIECLNEITGLMASLRSSQSVQFRGKDNLGLIVETCLSKEYVISEVGHISSEYMGLESQGAKYLKEQAKDLLPGDKDFTTAGEEPVDTRFDEEMRLRELENQYNKYISRLSEDILASAPNLHQVRYCSNEVIVYDREASKFSAYELYTDMAYQKEFAIFNNCGTFSIGTLVFFFGGEDPSELEVTSARSFVVDTSENIGRKSVVKELPKMFNARQEFTLSSRNGSVYLISGYDGTKSRDKKVIAKCERFDLRKFKFYEIRDVNYPRQWASSTFTDENTLYLFNGSNFNYILTFVDKIEKYRVNLNDWMSIKFSVLDNLEFSPGIKGFCCPLSSESIFVFGGTQEGNPQPNSNFILDTKKNILRIYPRKLLKEQDEFGNNSDILVTKGAKDILVCSGQFARRLYSFNFLKEEEDGAHYEFFVKTLQHSIENDA